ncbi:uncharacterized protein KY384_005851 [Bacidia gigantensis]|uniref:uncharacterized protein n=1 Tax=Bacidia gigantensis TaxID=2732470 RepID=UPI001D042767|nr:uncharacterized protein KY384_005851 [Bacidia gigantensis]KAG8529216.1 hypothetical protein KY384_005851 [Bacidia gigantensis]
MALPFDALTSYLPQTHITFSSKPHTDVFSIDLKPEHQPTEISHEPAFQSEKESEARAQLTSGQLRSSLKARAPSIAFSTNTDPDTDLSQEQATTSKATALSQYWEMKGWRKRLSETWATSAGRSWIYNRPFPASFSWALSLLSALSILLWAVDLE